MKTINNKIIKAMAIFMLLAVMVTVFASCSSSIEGTYKATTNDGERHVSEPSFGNRSVY